MKYAFVTGANRGIGKGFVDYLLDNGYFVFGASRKVTDQLANKKNLQWIQLDLESDESIEKAVKKVAKKTKKLNLLINNAGLNKDTATNNDKKLVTKLNHLSRKHLIKLFNVNSIAPLILFKQFLPLLSQTNSFVINVSSCRASYQDEVGNNHANYGYRASKAALNMMTHASTWDLPENVKTFAVHPGSVKTDMNPTGSDDSYQQAEKMIAITKNWKPEFNGKFLRYSGELYPL